MLRRNFEEVDGFGTDSMIEVSNRINRKQGSN